MDVILTLILLALIVVACGMLAERYLLRGPRVVMGQIDEDTCEEHGVFLCERCFDLDLPTQAIGQRWEDSPKSAAGRTS